MVVRTGRARVNPEACGTLHLGQRMSKTSHDWESQAYHLYIYGDLVVKIAGINHSQMGYGMVFTHLSASQPGRGGSEQFAIFGSQRARRGAELKALWCRNRHFG